MDTGTNAWAIYPNGRLTEVIILDYLKSGRVLVCAVKGGAIRQVSKENLFPSYEAGFQAIQDDLSG